MGQRLYGDPALALRELYQNALDACRYRRARQTHLAETDVFGAAPYRGVIEIRRGVADGRHYVECIDNGVGMSKGIVEHVFAVAGQRFHDQVDFARERPRWGPDYDFVPNSQHGIGVLSYFMLADEVEVETREYCPDGRKGAPLEIRIRSASGLFDLRPGRVDQSCGSRVRLYLTSTTYEGDAGQAIDVDPVGILSRLLVVSEFDVIVANTLTGARLQWARDVPNADVGDFVPTDHPDVWWSNAEQPILADGIVTEQSHPWLLVNLTGERYPRLTLDRRRIVGDLELDWLPDVFGAESKRLLELPWLTHSFLRTVLGADPSLLAELWPLIRVCDRSLRWTGPEGRRSALLPGKPPPENPLGVFSLPTQIQDTWTRDPGPPDEEAPRCRLDRIGLLPVAPPDKTDLEQPSAQVAFAATIWRTSLGRFGRVRRGNPRLPLTELVERSRVFGGARQAAEVDAERRAFARAQGAGVATLIDARAVHHLVALLDLGAGDGARLATRIRMLPDLSGISSDDLIPSAAWHLCAEARPGLEPDVLTRLALTFDELSRELRGAWRGRSKVERLAASMHSRPPFWRIDGLSQRVQRLTDVVDAFGFRDNGARLEQIINRLDSLDWSDEVAQRVDDLLPPAAFFSANPPLIQWPSDPDDMTAETAQGIEALVPLLDLVLVELKDPIDRLRSMASVSGDERIALDGLPSATAWALMTGRTHTVGPAAICLLWRRLGWEVSRIKSSLEALCARFGWDLDWPAHERAFAGSRWWEAIRQSLEWSRGSSQPPVLCGHALIQYVPNEMIPAELLEDARAMGITVPFDDRDCEGLAYDDSWITRGAHDHATEGHPDGPCHELSDRRGMSDPGEVRRFGRFHGHQLGPLLESAERILPVLGARLAEASVPVPHDCFRVGPVVWRWANRAGQQARDGVDPAEAVLLAGRKWAWWLTDEDIMHVAGDLPSRVEEDADWYFGTFAEQIRASWLSG